MSSKRRKNSLGNQSQITTPHNCQYDVSQSISADYQWMPPWMPRRASHPQIGPIDLQVLKGELLNYSKYSMSTVPLLIFTEHNKGMYWSPFFEVLMVEAMWKLPVLQGIFNIRGVSFSTHELVACYINRQVEYPLSSTIVKERFDKTLELLSSDKEFLDVCLRNMSYYTSQYEMGDLGTIEAFIDDWMGKVKENGWLENEPAFVTQAYLHINFLQSKGVGENLRNSSIMVQFCFVADPEQKQTEVVNQSLQEIPAVSDAININPQPCHQKGQNDSVIANLSSLSSERRKQLESIEKDIVASVNTKLNITQETYAVKSLQHEDIIYRSLPSIKRALLYQMVALLTDTSAQNTAATLVICRSDRMATACYERLKPKIGGRVKMLLDPSNYDITFTTNEMPLIVYIKPSVFFDLQYKAHKTLCKNLNIRRVVFDEDGGTSSASLSKFRENYLKFLNMRQDLGSFAISIVCDFMDETVQAQISARMGNNFVNLEESFDHPLAFHQVVHKPRKEKDLVSRIASLCEKHTGIGIIRCSTVKECERMAESLCSVGIKASSIYTIQSECEDIETWFRSNTQTRLNTDRSTRVICTTSTNAFRAYSIPIKFLIHVRLSVSMLQYYTEINDIYRDNLLYCYTLFNPGDRFWIADKLDFLRTRELDDMLKFCENISVCRRKYLLNYLNIKFDSPNCHNMCDLCELELGNVNPELTDDYRMIVAVVQQSVGNEIPSTMLCAHLLGDSSSTMRRSSTFGSLRNFGYTGVKSRLSYLIENKILESEQKRGITTITIAT